MSDKTPETVAFEGLLAVFATYLEQLNEQANVDDEVVKKKLDYIRQINAYHKREYPDRKAKGISASTHIFIGDLFNILSNNGTVFDEYQSIIDRLIDGDKLTDIIDEPSGQTTEYTV